MLYVAIEGHSLVQLLQRPFSSSRELASLVFSYPEVVSTYLNSNGPSSATWACRMVPKDPAWVMGQGGDSLDQYEFLLLSPDAVPSLVLVRKLRNPEDGRMLVGTLIDHVANLMDHWPVDTVRQWFETLCRRRGKNPEDELRAVVGSAKTPVDFWYEMLVHMQAKRIRVVMVSDTAVSRFSRVLAFFRDRSPSLEVYWLEMQQYVGNRYRVLIPRLVYGPAGKVQEDRAHPQWVWAGGLAPPKGSTPSLELPLEVDADALAGLKSEHPPTPQETPEPRDVWRVLVMEEDLGMATAVKNLLERDRYRVEITSDGLQGIQQVLVWKPHLVIIDDDLPKLPGRDVARILKQNRQTLSIPILLLTSHLHPDDLLTHADGVLRKPIDLTTLLTKVNRLRDLLTAWAHR